MSSGGWWELTPGYNVPPDPPIIPGQPYGPSPAGASLDVPMFSGQLRGSSHENVQANTPMPSGEPYGPIPGPSPMSAPLDISMPPGRPHSSGPASVQHRPAAPLGTSAVPKRRTQSDTIMRAALMNATTASLEELTRDWRRIQVEGPAAVERNAQRRLAFQHWQDLSTRHAMARQNSPMDIPVPGADGVVYPTSADQFGFGPSPYDPDAVFDNPVNCQGVPPQPTTNSSYTALPTGISPLFFRGDGRSRIQIEFDQLCHMRRVSEAAILDIARQVNGRLQYAHDLSVEYGQQNAMPQILPILGFVTHAEQIVQGHKEIISTVDQSFDLMAARGVTLEDMVPYPS